MTNDAPGRPARRPGLVPPLLLLPLLLLALAGLAGCSALPVNAGAKDSVALPPDPASPLGRIAFTSMPAADESGVRLLPLGAYSLDARLQLIRRATTSIDLQYYVLDDDGTGRLLLAALRDAALRGVRVRLLVDDLYTGGSETLLLGLAAYADVEVRLFNPFCCARGGGAALRFAASPFDFERLNHRMHNKLFIADGIMAVAGGRNIADEYFQRAADVNFVDMDAFVMGAVVADFAGIFDRYWNSGSAYPIGLIIGASEGEGEETMRRQAFDAAVAGVPAGPLDLPDHDILGYGPLREEFDRERVELQWGKARAFADPPDKVVAMTPQVAYEMSVTFDVMAQIFKAQRELVLISPYLVPGARGMAEFRHLKEEGVKVTVVTNSLAATDEPLVYEGYSHYRVPMLELGVDLYELSPTGTRPERKRLGAMAKSLGRLHQKSAVIDRHLVFIGSMNLDPRSANTNTELGMFIDSPALAKEMLQIINVSKLEGAYRLRLQPQTRALQWLTLDGEKEVVLESEPESTYWSRVRLMWLSWFVPDALL